MDAFEDHGELEVGEGRVPGQRAHVAAGAGGVALHDLGGLGVAGRAARGGHGGALDRLLLAVHHQQAQVGERVAERGHLPVQDRVDPVVGGDQDVVEAVVAVHDGGGRGARQLPGERAVQLVDAGQLAVAGRLQLLAPAAELPLQEPLGPPEVREADRGRLDGVQPYERVGEAEDHVAGAPGADGRELLGAAVRRAVHELHDVEGRSDDGLVLAEQQCPGHRHGGVVQRADHPVLAPHVVGGGEYVAERRAAHHPAGGAVGDRVREVGAASFDQLGGERRRRESGAFAVQVRAQPLQVEPRRVALAHRVLLGVDVDEWNGMELRSYAKRVDRMERAVRTERVARMGRGAYAEHDADQSVCRPVIS